MAKVTLEDGGVTRSYAGDFAMIGVVRKDENDQLTARILGEPSHSDPFNKFLIAMLLLEQVAEKDSEVPFAALSHKLLLLVAKNDPNKEKKNARKRKT